MSSQKRRVLGNVYVGLVVFIAYAGLAAITTWPLVTTLTTHLPGSSRDSLLHYWNGWWVKQALANGQSPFHTPYLFYPNGVSLVTHNIAWLHIVPWLLLDQIVDGILAYNMCLLLSLTFCGCAAFLLVYQLTAHHGAAFLAGLIYQAWPFRLSQLDHPNLLATQWIPVFFLFLICGIQKGRWRDSVFAGLSFALVGFTRWQLLIPLTVMGLTYIFCAAPQWLPKRRRYIVSRLVVAASVALILVLPPALLLLGQQEGENSYGTLLYASEEPVMQTDIMAYVTPPSSHPVLGEWTGPLYDRYYSDRLGRRYPAYVGFVALLLALIGVKFKRRKSLPWVFMAVILLSLALGPVLRCNGVLYPKAPTLYRLLSPLFVIRLMRVPDRFNMFLALPISTLAGYGVAGLVARKRGHPWWGDVLFCGIVGGLILFEYLVVPVPLQDVSSTASSYAQVAEEPGDFGVLNIPFDRLKAKGYMFDQISHHRPIVQGNVSRFPKGSYTYIDNNPWLRVLRQSEEMPPALTDVSRQLSSLAEDDIRYIIMHKGLVGTDRVAHWRRYLSTQPRYEDEHVAIYATSPEAGRDFTLIDELVPGLGPIDTLVSADCQTPGRVLEVDVCWGSSRTLDTDFDVVVSLVDRAGLVRQAERFPTSTTWPTSEWPLDTIVWGYYRLVLSPSIPTGGYTITLALVDSETGRNQSQPVSIQPLTVQSEICDLATVPGAQDVNAVFGDRLRLLEYQMRQEEGRLDLTLYWRSDCRMDTDYTFFVHVADRVTGIPVAQHDSRPRHSSYPTTFWWPGETVDDRISIPLSGVPAGSYDIAIGVYELSTGDRLPLINSQGQAIADGRLILEETVEMR